MTNKGLPSTNATPLDPASPLAKGGEFELAISPAKLKNILATKTSIIELDPQEAYDKLSLANQIALAHLVKAAIILEKVFLKQDHPDNLRAEKILREEAARSTPTADVARDALTFFEMRKGMEGDDKYAKKPEPLRLFKNKHLHLQPGKAFYPQDITKEELKAYVLKHPEEATAIFANNTIVRRDGDRLIADTYATAFPEEMQAAAQQIMLAADATDHVGFAKYLRLKAQALVNDQDDILATEADKAWVDAEESPIEFTVTLENYMDKLSPAVAGDPEVAAMLKANGLIACQKDSIGVRVGIVNMESYAQITQYREARKIYAQEAPLHEEFTKQATDLCAPKTALADVDLVAFTGDRAAIRSGIAIAQNLPNSDKRSKQYGSRIVFHRQVRDSADPKMKEKMLRALVVPEQRHLYSSAAGLSFTAGHEEAHSEGPPTTKDGRDKKSALGTVGNTVEENKADQGSVKMTDICQRTGTFTPEQAAQVYMTWAVSCILSKQPPEDNPHATRALMQFNYFREKGAFTFEPGGKLSIAPEKVAPTAVQMLYEIHRVQLDGDSVKATDFVKKYAVWNEAAQYGAAKKMKLKPKLYCRLVQPMRDRLELIADSLTPPALPRLMSEKQALVSYALAVMSPP